MKKVLVVNQSFPKVALELLKTHTQCIVVPHMDYDKKSLPTIKQNVKNVDAIIWNTKHRLNAEILDLAGPQLKAVSTTSSGLDQVDVNEMKKRGIPLGHTLKVLDNAVADITVGLLIAAARRFKEGVDDIYNNKWAYGINWTLGQDITGSTVGVMGLGGIGQAVVRRLKGFDVKRFIYYGRSDKPEAKLLMAERVNLDVLFKESDFLILSCPLTEDTENIINEKSLKIMKSNAVLVNIARGGLVDQNALYVALKEGTIFAAGLDVVTPEPIAKDHPLLTLPNCFIIPHMGSATINTRNSMAIMSVNNVLLALDGKTMECQYQY